MTTMIILQELEKHNNTLDLVLKGYIEVTKSLANFEKRIFQLENRAFQKQREISKPIPSINKEEKKLCKCGNPNCTNEADLEALLITLFGAQNVVNENKKKDDVEQTTTEKETRGEEEESKLFL